MRNKIKIIDLLCLISNGEEVPKKIKYQNYIYEYQHRRDTESSFNYTCNENGEYLSRRYFIDNILNDEVEILDEEDKDIPLIPDDELIILKQEKAIDMQKAIDYNFKVLKEKINQVVEELNKRQ